MGEAKRMKTKVTGAAAASVAALLLVSSCGFKTNPTEDYRDLKGVQPYSAAPSASPSKKTQGAFFASVYADADRQKEVSALEFVAGKASTFYVYVQSRLPNGAGEFTISLKADGLPAGVSQPTPVEGTVGLFRIVGKPDATSAFSCGDAASAAGSPAQSAKLSWTVIPGPAASDALRSELNNLGLSERAKSVDVSVRAASAQGQPSLRVVETDLSVQSGRETSFTVRAENLQTDAAHAPTLGVADKPAALTVSFDDASMQGVRAGDSATTWEWKMKLSVADAKAAGGPAQFKLNLLDTCRSGKESASVAVAATIAQPAPEAKPDAPKPEAAAPKPAAAPGRRRAPVARRNAPAAAAPTATGAY